MTVFFVQPSPQARGWVPAIPDQQPDAGAPDQCPPQTTPRQPAGDIALEQAFLNVWPARDQFERGTCVAFAATAMLELHRALQEDMAPVRLSEHALYAAMRARGRPSALKPADWDAGATMLTQARDVLRDVANGTATLDWFTPYRPVAPTRRLSGRALFGTRTPTPGLPHPQLVLGWPPEPCCKPHPDNDLTKSGGDIVDRLIELLQCACPVAAAFPAFPHDSGRTNWTLPEAWSTGVVHCTEDHGAPPFGPASTASGGHVVCLTGFRHDPNEPNGGWFVFRNSWGLNFANAARANADRMSPPARGYGLISATHIKLYCWEYMAPDPSGSAAAV